jgi:hypothetical protein
MPSVAATMAAIGARPLVELDHAAAASCSRASACELISSPSSVPAMRPSRDERTVAAVAQLGVVRGCDQDGGARGPAAWRARSWRIALAPASTLVERQDAGHSQPRHRVLLRIAELALMANVE